MVIFDEFEKIDRLNVRSVNQVEGTIRFGASSSIASYLVPAIFERLRQSHPRVLPMSYSAPADVLLEQVSDSVLEFSILLYGGMIPNDLEAITLAELNHSIVILAQKYNSTEVRRSFIGTREGHSVRAKDYPTLKRIQEIDPKTQVRMSSNDLSCHKEFVMRGLGIAVLPDFSVSNELKNGTLRRVYPKEAFKFPVHLVKRKRKVLSQVGQAFVQSVQVTLNDVANSAS
jgi:DNA-binding transcriptional LysR family regulator